MSSDVADKRIFLLFELALEPFDHGLGISILARRKVGLQVEDLFIITFDALGGGKFRNIFDLQLEHPHGDRVADLYPLLLGRGGGRKSGDRDEQA